MNSVLSRWLPCATLSLWALVMLYYAKAQGAVLTAIGHSTHLFSGRIEAFLIPTFRPYVLLAGFVLAGLALLMAFSPASAACCQASDCAHPLARFTWGKWLSFLVLIVPVTVTARYSSDSFGANAMQNRGVITDAASLPQVTGASVSKPLDLPLPSNTPVSASSAPAPAATPTAQSNNDPKDYLVHLPNGNISAEVLDLLYAAQDPTLRKDFEGKKVELIGQLMPDTSTAGSGKRIKAVRMFMTCCAADARPVATLVEANDPKLPEMTWIKVTGIATFPIENGRRTAVLKADLVEKTEPPAETMLY